MKQERNQEFKKKKEIERKLSKMKTIKKEIEMKK